MDLKLMDLNDDCLREVFKCLNVEDLCAVADACRRFKQIAQALYKTTGDKQFVWANKNQAVAQSSLIRNFGVFFEGIEVVGRCREKYECSATKLNKIIDILVRYSSENMIELELVGLKITHDVAFIMRPLLRHLQTLQIEYCELSEVFLERCRYGRPM